MKLVIDENIPFAKQIFGKLGEISLLPGREIRAESIRDASILLVRSITKVNEDLLRGSAVEFVGSATAGLDHIDQGYLKKQQILFASAAGSNAESVAEYVITALFAIAKGNGTRLKGASLGVIGVGHIGKLLEKKATALGMEVILNDPPLKRKTGDPLYRSFKEACEADFVSLHVPLINEGIDATTHLFDEASLSNLNPKTVLINTSRGAVVDNIALFQAISKNRLSKSVLDVWEGEPDVNWALLRLLKIGTPHIAGYALDGKLEASSLIYDALCAALGTSPVRWENPLSSTEMPKIEINAAGRTEFEVLSNLVMQAYDLAGDHQGMQRLCGLSEKDRPAQFDALRKHYPIRRAFRNTTVIIKNAPPALRHQVKGIGFIPAFL